MTPLTDALIAKLDLEPEARLVFVVRQLINHAKDMERGRVASETKACAWSLDDDGIYQTECGEHFVFSDGSRTECKAKYCGNCGAKITGAK